MALRLVCCLLEFFQISRRLSVKSLAASLRRLIAKASNASAPHSGILHLLRTVVKIRSTATNY